MNITLTLTPCVVNSADLPDPDLRNRIATGGPPLFACGTGDPNRDDGGWLLWLPASCAAELVRLEQYEVAHLLVCPGGAANWSDYVTLEWSDAGDGTLRVVARTVPVEPVA